MTIVDGERSPRTAAGAAPRKRSGVDGRDHRDEDHGDEDHGGEDHGEQGVSTATVERFYRGVLIALAVAVVAALFGGAAVWAVRADDPGRQPMNAVDVGFLRDMIDHHEQALLIANIYLDERPDSGVAPYAREVILYQQRDLDRMRAWLADAGYSPGEPDRVAMEWMGEPTPVAEMPGMQTPERLAELDAATGEQADLLFFQIMSDHHLGGIHMAEHASINGSDQEIMDFAASVAENQNIEIAEYVGAAKRLGLI